MEASGKPVLWPGMPLADLRAWATKHDVMWAINGPIREMALDKGFRWSPLLWDHGHDPVHRFVTMAKTEPRWGHEVHRGLGAFLIGGLAQRALAQRTAIEQEKIPAPPADEVLARAFASVLAIRTLAREQLPPMPLPPFPRATVQADPPKLILRSYPPPSAYGAGEIVTQISLDSGDDLDDVECVCANQPCRHLVATCDYWLKVLSEGVPAQLLATIRESLAVPAWMRALEALDKAFVRVGATQLVAQDETRIGWRLNLNRNDIELVPLLCTPKARGGGYKTKNANPAEVEQLLLRASPVDRAVGEVLELGGRSHWSGSRRDSRERRAILKLVGHPRVYLRDAGAEPVRVVVKRVGLSMHQEADGSVILGTTHDDEAADPKVLCALLASAAPDPFVDWNEETGEIEVTSVPNGLMPVLATIADRGGRFPPDALAALVRRLPALNAVAEVQTSGLRGLLRLPADATIRVQLEVGDNDALTVRLRVRPLVGGELQIPGEGSVELFAEAKGMVHSTLRDLVVEAAAAGQVRASLPEGIILVDEPLAWRYLDGDQAIAVLSILKTLGEHAIVEWTGPEVRVSAPARASQLKVTVGSSQDWFGLRGTVDVDGVTATLTEILGALRRGQRFIKVEGGVWLQLEDKLRERLLSLSLVTQAKKGSDELMPIHAGALQAIENAGAKVEASKSWVEWIDKMSAVQGYQPKLPKLTAKLRPYQEEGFAWMMRLASWAGGAVLADDMGLGKTLQALSVLAARAKVGPALVITPTSVSFNWLREAERFAPQLKLHLHRGADRRESLEGLGPNDVLVTSYDLVVNDVEMLLTQEWSTLILDESQAVKNANTLRAQAIKRLNAKFRIALSGTPIENRLSELWSLFSIVLPGLFGGWTEFAGRFASPIERHGDKGRRESLAGMIRPFILRRMKREVATELPEREEVRVDVVLSSTERKAYDALRTAALDMMAGLDDTPPQQRQFKVLAAITRLRQLACHPKLCEPQSIAPSAKLEALLQLIDELRDGGRRALVFSQFTEHLALVRESLDEMGLKYRYLDGSTPEKQRRGEVDAFQRGEGDLFLLSLKAGGTGLNLTAATDVIILDPWWNPAVEDQAADRAHRIGQTRKVTVWRLVATDTIEEQILALHGKKRDLVASVLDGTGKSGAMSVEELMALLRG